MFFRLKGRDCREETKIQVEMSYISFAFHFHSHPFPVYKWLGCSIEEPKQNVNFPLRLGKENRTGMRMVLS